jgi:protein SCO1/2
LLLLLSSLAFVGCKTTQPAQPGKRYELKGTVVSVDKAQKSATIAHEEIKDFMDAMTMDYTLKETWPLDVMKPGDQIQATLVVTDGSAWLEDVVISQKTGPQNTPQGDSSSLPKVGDAIPDFRLVNQDGKPIQLSQYRGRALLLTFIYTRCPLPQYCTLMTNNFAVIDGELRKDPKRQLRFGVRQPESIAKLRRGAHRRVRQGNFRALGVCNWRRKGSEAYGTILWPHISPG